MKPHSSLSREPRHAIVYLLPRYLSRVVSLQARRHVLTATSGSEVRHFYRHYDGVSDSSTQCIAQTDVDMPPISGKFTQEESLGVVPHDVHGYG